MAIFRPGPIASSVSGTIAGTTFAATRNGPVVRTSPSKINPQTIAQVAARNRLSRAQNAWLSLTAAQRNSWRAAAASKLFANRLGIPRHITGHQLYLRTYLIYAACTLPAPTTPGPLIATPILNALIYNQPQTNYVFYIDAATPQPKPYGFTVRACYSNSFLPPLPTQFIPAPPVRIEIGTIETNITATYVPVFGPPQAGKYFHTITKGTATGYMPGLEFPFYTFFQ